MVMRDALDRVPVAITIIYFDPRERDLMPKILGVSFVLLKSDGIYNKFNDRFGAGPGSGGA
ncbi:hypothetical protein [Patulibacter minatonensis]|uniref:hypothetical protein n=1 Tax=Patulibacter minatonensis TaxID=298163 RepID=UPI000479A1B7|nr:hypothetical protein [Patulibacter minatonensis]